MLIMTEEDYENSIDQDYLDWQESLTDNAPDFDSQDYAEYLEEFDSGEWEAEEAWLKHAEDGGLEDA